MTSTQIPIRPATPEDARAIAHAQVETWKTAYRGIIADDFLDTFSVDERTDRWTEVLQRPEQGSFVAEIDDALIGFANGGPERDGHENFKGELYGLYVFPDWHGQGVGKRLVTTFADWLLGSGIATMLVWTLADNPYRRFYERLGGKIVAERDIEIGEQKLTEVAYGWDEVATLLGTENAS